MLKHVFRLTLAGMSVGGMYPLELQPQHMGCPLDLNKHVWQEPQVIAIASLAP